MLSKRVSVRQVSVNVVLDFIRMMLPLKPNRYTHAHPQATALALQTQTPPHTHQFDSLLSVRKGMNFSSVNTLRVGFTKKDAKRKQ